MAPIRRGGLVTSEIELLRLVGLAALLICTGAYGVGYLFRPEAFRPWHVASLCCTTLALTQLYLALYAEGGGRLNADYAMAYLVASGLAQAVIAVSRRPKGRREVDADG